MTCADRRADLIAYLDGELAPAARAELESHLAGCAECQAALAEERRLSGMLESLPAVDPPADFEARFWARIAHESEGARIAREAEGARPSASPPPRRRLVTRRLALAFGATAAAAAAAVLALRFRGEEIEDEADLQIVANPQDFDLLEDPDLELLEVVDLLEDWDGESGDPG